MIFVMREFPQMGCVVTMDDSLSLEERREEVDDLRPVSYTHLTLPTICSV